MVAVSVTTISSATFVIVIVIVIMLPQRVIVHLVQGSCLAIGIVVNMSTNLATATAVAACLCTVLLHNLSVVTVHLGQAVLSIIFGPADCVTHMACTL